MHAGKRADTGGDQLGCVHADIAAIKPRYKFYQALTDDLLAFAEREFVLSAIQSDGCSTRDHLKKAAKFSGVEHELIATAPSLPSGAAHVWLWFIECRHECKQADRITATIMQSVEWAVGVRMQLWERSAIRRLDSIFQQVRNDRSQPDN